MCGLEVSALGQCGNFERKVFRTNIVSYFSFYEAVEGLTRNEQFLLVLSGQKRIKHRYNINSRILCSEK